MDGAPVSLPRSHVGCLDDSEAGTQERKDAYRSDITYGTNNEFGFDYLRDNMVTALEQRVQRVHVDAIVDEGDSVLIDEARTPLIISGPVGNESDAQYFEHNAAVARLVRKQTELVNVLVADGERLLESGNTGDAGVKLYQAQLGHPKNRRLLKLMNEQGNKQLVQKMELEHLADRSCPAKQAFRDIEEGCSSSSTSAGTRCTSPTAAWISCRRRSTRRSCCPTSAIVPHRSRGRSIPRGRSPRA